MSRAGAKQRSSSFGFAAVLGQLLQKVTAYQYILRPISGRAMSWAFGIKSRLVTDNGKDDSTQGQIDKLHEYHGLAKVSVGEGLICLSYPAIDSL